MNKDQRIVKEIEGVLSNDPRVEIEQCNLTMTSEEGFATLSGTVPSVAAKRLALRLTQGIPGVTGVKDDLQVATHDPMGDMEIVNHIRYAFIQEGNLEEGHILIDADPAGGVRLRGHVSSITERNAAEEDCWFSPGVNNVANELRVS